MNGSFTPDDHHPNPEGELVRLLTSNADPKADPQADPLREGM